MIPILTVDCPAAMIAYSVTDLADPVSGEDLWLYTYRVSDFNFSVGQGFSATFGSNLFTKLQSPPASVNSDWDVLTLQPDLLLSSGGLYDAQARVNAPSLADVFKVTAVWLGTGTPGSQSFTIYDSNFATIEQGQTTLIQQSQTITFSLLADRTTNSPSFALSAAASSGLPVSFSLVSGPATVLGDVVTLTGAVGTVVIRAAQTGSASFAPATPVERSFTVSQSNQAPSATAVSISTPEDTGILVVLSGTDPENGPLTYPVVSAPTHGTLTGSPPNLFYQPNMNFFGADSFTFVVNDGQTNSAPANVSLTISPVNDVPVAEARRLIVQKNKALVVVLTGTDSEKSGLKYSIVKGPKKGKLKGKAPNFTYKPNLNATGADSFTFRVNDGTADSSIATVNIAIKTRKPGKVPKKPTESKLTRTSAVVPEEKMDIPLPWMVTEIGGFTQSDKVSYEAGNFTLTGSGTFEPLRDDFPFIYQTLSGDGGIVAKVSPGLARNTSVQAGVMIRESLATNARHVFISLNGRGACHVTNRVNTGGSHSQANITRQSADEWLRLLRRGNWISAYTSRDGTSWTLAGTFMVSMANRCYIGLTASDGASSNPPSFRYSHVSVTP